MTKVDNIIKAYANGLKGLTREECLKEDFSARQCEVLESALNIGSEGIITDEEKTMFEQTGFAKDFIQDLAGIDGKKALQSRVRWLTDHIDTKWYRLDYSLNQRMEMVRELETIGPLTEDPIPALILALKNEDDTERFIAAMDLRNIGPNAKDAIPALIDALKDKVSPVRCMAAGALGNIGKQAFFAIPVLQQMAEADHDHECRRVAQEALDKMMEEIR